MSRYRFTAFRGDETEVITSFELAVQTTPRAILNDVLANTIKYASDVVHGDDPDRAIIEVTAQSVTNPDDFHHVRAVITYGK